MTTFGCAYWGRDANVAEQHFSELTYNGFSWVVIPISTERMRYDREGASAIVGAAERVGLETRIAPWGVGGLFGGEGISEACTPNQAELSLYQWLDRANDYVAPDAMYWDEPHGEFGLRVMQEARSRVTIPGEREYIYINPDLCEWPTVTTGIDGVGIDVYQPIGNVKEKYENVVARYNAPVHVWVRNFSLPPLLSTQPAQIINTLIKSGIPDIGIWGYPSDGCSCLNNAEPDRAWNAILEVVRGNR